MQLCNDQRGVCKGTPVAVTGLPHPELSTKLAIEKRRRRQYRFGGPFRGARLFGAGSSDEIVGHPARIHINQLLNRLNGFATATNTGRIQGVSALFRDSAYLAKILGGATDGSTVGGSTVVYNLMSLLSIIAISRCTNSVR